MIYPNYVKQTPVLGLTSGAAGGASLSYFTHVVAAPPGGDVSGSVSFDGDGDYLTIPSSSDLTFGTGDFTVEMWVYADNFNNRNTFYDSRPSGGTTGLTIGSEVSTGQLKVYMNATSGSDQIVDTTDFSAGLWHHIAVTCASGSVRLFVNGVLKDTGTGRNLSNTNAVNIGYRTYTSSSYDYMDGRISNFRVMKGTALYTSNFTVPAAPLTNITSTKLLCCNSTISATSSTITPGTIVNNGGATASTSTPFSAGSVYFNDSSLQLASNSNLCPGTSDFTFECWLKPTNWGSSWETVYMNGVYNGFYVGKDDSGNFVVRASSNTSFITQSTLPSANQWTHIAVTRQGSTLRLFYNGVLKNSVSNSHNFPTAATSIAETTSSGEGIHGKISNLRFIKGTALYTSNFTTPTAKLTDVTNTKLLCCQSAGPVTAAAVTPETITTSGNVIASNSSPFISASSGSVDFTGEPDETDYLNVAKSSNFDFSGVFTFEAWAYFDTLGYNSSSTPQYGGVDSNGRSQTKTIAESIDWNAQAGQYHFGVSSNNKFHFYVFDGGTSQNRFYTGNTTISTGQWYHFMVNRDSSDNIRLYVNGARQTVTKWINQVSQGSSSYWTESTSLSNSNQPNPLRIGATKINSAYSMGGITGMDGKISNLRMTTQHLYGSGSTISVPISELTTTSQGVTASNVKLLCCQDSSNASIFTKSPTSIGAYNTPTASISTPNFVTLPSSAVFYASGADFTDVGPNGYTITKVGNGLTSGNSTSKSGGGSFRFDGSDTQQYFYAGSNTFLNDSLSSWQFQCWARYDSGNAGNVSGDMGMLVDQYVSGVSGRLLFGFQANSLVMRVNGGTVELTSGAILSNNTWLHVLLNWDGTTHRLFTDGILRDSSTTVPAVYTGKRTEFGGGGDLGGYNLHGYMEHVLVENGGTVKTSNFTPNNSGFVT